MHITRHPEAFGYTILDLNELNYLRLLQNIRTTEASTSMPSIKWYITVVRPHTRFVLQCLVSALVGIDPRDIIQQTTVLFNVQTYFNTRKVRDPSLLGCFS